MVITTANLGEISYTDLRTAAEEMVDDGCGVVLYVDETTNGMRVETLVVNNSRCGQAAGGNAVWGEWRGGVVLTDSGDRLKLDGTEA